MFAGSIHHRVKERSVTPTSLITIPANISHCALGQDQPQRWHSSFTFFSVSLCFCGDDSWL